MKLSLLIRPELIAVPIRAIDKWQTLAALAELPVRAGCYAASAMPAILDAILLRERSMSTGMEFGVAIPHAAVDGIDELITVLGICPDGIPFDAVDKQPARIVVLLIIPRQKNSRTSKHWRRSPGCCRAAKFVRGYLLPTRRPKLCRR